MSLENKSPCWLAALVIVVALVPLWGQIGPHRALASSGRDQPPQSVQPLPPALALLADTATPTPTLTEAERLAQLEDELDAAWAARDWPEVLDVIDEMQAIDPEYDDLARKEYQAHINYGWELMAQGLCTESLTEFRTALALEHDDDQAEVGLELVARYCATPVPGATPSSTLTPGATVQPTATPQEVGEPFSYTVQAGDTMYSLAKRYGTTVQAIMRLNGRMTYYLRSGETIWIPASGAEPSGPLVHIVQPGETLYSIAQDYGTTVWAIMSANGLPSERIWAYQALFIPNFTGSGPIIHIVQPGETLYSIAQQRGSTVSLIMLANELNGYEIYVGQHLVIPGEGWSGWPSGYPGGTTGRYYLVRAGDTLYSIARRYGTTVAALMAANDLSSSLIVPGMTLLIP